MTSVQVSVRFEPLKIAFFDKSRTHSRFCGEAEEKLVGDEVGEAECVILYEPDARHAMLIARELGMEKCNGSRNVCRASFVGDTSG